MTALDRKTIQAGDMIHVAYAGSNYEGPYYHVWGGEVLATGGGSVVYRTADGSVDTLQSWSALGVYGTEGEALEAAAEALERMAAKFLAKAAECRAKAVAEVAA
jgi:hypothetical protein